MTLRNSVMPVAGASSTEAAPGPDFIPRKQASLYLSHTSSDCRWQQVSSSELHHLYNRDSGTAHWVT